METKNHWTNKYSDNVKDRERFDIVIARQHQIIDQQIIVRDAANDAIQAAQNLIFKMTKERANYLEERNEVNK